MERWATAKHGTDFAGSRPAGFLHGLRDTGISPTVDNGDMTAAYTIRPITPADDAAMAALIRRILEDAGLDRPGTAYCDPQLDRLAEHYAGLERPGAYWVMVERLVDRDGSGSGDTGGGIGCDSGAGGCAASGNAMNGCNAYSLSADGIVVGGVGIAAWPGSEDTCELQKLYVVADRRGLGLGRRLLETALAFAGGHYRRCYLETHSSLKAACGLYRAMGFEFLDGPLPGGEHSAMDMWAVKEVSKGDNEIYDDSDK